MMKLNPLTYPEILQIFYDIVDALNFSNSKLIAHSDIKPSNIAKVGNYYKLFDWGSALLPQE